VVQLSAAAPGLSVNATTIAFGNVDLNAPATQSITLTSTGTSPVTVNSATTSGTGFSASGLTFPLTLNPGQTATLSVAFNPTTAVLFTGALTISSNASSNGTVTISLSGTGISVTYDVDLSWSAPTDNTDPVSGYRIYRAPTGSSTYQVLNSSLNTPTTFTDANVVSGTTYQYYVTSVDAAGAESVPSNIATIAIP
jgi:hypothetical protein